MSDTAITEAAEVDLGFPVFLTAYDPSDLPGGSLDPLGFDRGYLLLAGKILPGLTNVAARPRYFSILCAGAFLAEVGVADPPRVQYQKRLERVLRFERFWALANVLASQDRSDGALSSSGIRGVTYASTKAGNLIRNGSDRTDSDFQLLSRQVPYGVVGIYGAVAEGMRFIDRKTFTLTPDLGERLGNEFLDQTRTPRMLINAVKNGTDVAIRKLAEWGSRAHIAGEPVPIEQRCFSEALHCNPVRSRMARVLSAHPFVDRNDSELHRLSRLLPDFANQTENRDLYEAVTAILAFESAYRLAMLGFERLLWLCRYRSSPSAAIRPADMAADTVLCRVCGELPASVQRLSHALDSATTHLFRQDIHRLQDVRQFLERAATACGGSETLSVELIERHSDVQRGKFDNGRRKMPWLEITSGRISLTMTRVGGLDREVTSPTQITPHPYRLASADALNAASGDT